MTMSEARLWSAISRGRAGARIRHQVPIGRWIADFASLDPKLVIEVDDPSHHWKDEIERTADLEAGGFAALRLTNRQVATDLDAAVTAIRNWITSLRTTGAPPQP